MPTKQSSDPKTDNEGRIEGNIARAKKIALYLSDQSLDRPIADALKVIALALGLFLRSLSTSVSKHNPDIAETDVFLVWNALYAKAAKIALSLHSPFGSSQPATEPSSKDNTEE